MADLPARPDLGQLRHQAKDLLHAAQTGDQAAFTRIRAVAAQVTLAGAQRAIAREYGYVSWAALKTDVEAHGTDLTTRVAAFCEASVRDQTGRAARMLAATPAIAGYNLATAVLLGDADRVRDELRRDPGAATRPDAQWGWTPLHAVCASRWYHLDPTRADGLLAVARLLLDAGADPNAVTDQRPGRPGWRPLRCVVAAASVGTGNEPILRLLLDRGATPDDHDLYLAGFANNAPTLLRLLLAHARSAGITPNSTTPGGNTTPPGIALAGSTALAAPISTGNVEAVRVLLEAGVDARRPLPGDLFGDGVPADPPIPPVAAAVDGRCPVDLIELLLTHGADPDAPGQHEQSPYRVATRQGRTDVVRMLEHHGARTDASDVDRFLGACAAGDWTAAERYRRRDPGLVGELTATDHAALVDAADHGRTDAVRYLLDVGFPLDARNEDGASPLHAAAAAGSAGTVRLLLDRGADLEARDTTWDSTPLDWAAVGSGLRLGHDPRPDWVATVQTLLDAGATTDGITLNPDDPKPPSLQVADLLRTHGVGTDEPH